VSRNYRAIALVWVIGATAGCTSARVRYYTLAASPDKTLAPSAIAIPIDVRVVHTPPQLIGSELMIRTGPTELTLLENERWVSPVKDEISNALRLELQRRLSRTSRLDSSVSKVTLEIDIQQLEAEFGQYARLEASWSATISIAGQRSTDLGAASCTFQANEKIRATYAGMVNGYQREIAALADAIVAVVARPPGDSDGQCRRPIAGSAGEANSREH
jgi:uncharacterized protein